MPEQHHNDEATQMAQFLTQLADKPSERFYDKMKNAPWAENAPQTHRPQNKALAAAAAIALLAFGLFFTPLGTLAQNVISNFFNPLPDATRQNTITVPAEPTPMSEAVFVQPQSIAQVEAEVGFDVAVPTNTLGYEFSDATTFIGDGVTQSALFYIYPGDELGRNLVIMQSPADVSDTRTEIGANAVIETVQIGAVTGEYVRGSWVARAEPTVVDNNSEGNVVQLDQLWSNDLGLNYLRWEADGMRYEILFQESAKAMLDDYEANPAAPGWLTRDDLVTIASSLD